MLSKLLQFVVRFVANVFNARAEVSKARSVVNVGDNFYWGGLDNTGPLQEKLSKDDGAKLFMSNQQTHMTQQIIQEWVPSVRSAKASMPPFNRRMELADVEHIPMEIYNLPVYGMKVPPAIMEILEIQGIRELAAELDVKIPKYTLSWFIQHRGVPNIRIMTKVAREKFKAAGDRAAIDKLDAFIDEFESLKIENVPNLEVFKAIVDRHCSKGWEDRLHFDIILQTNFGFRDEVVKELREYIHRDIDEKTGEEWTCSLETLSMRWVAKAMTGYQPEGCLTDVANAVYALQCIPEDSESTEDLIAKRMRDFSSRLKMPGKQGLEDLWIPTHFIHDAETDDTLTWLILEYLHRRLGTSMKVAAQLPDEAEANVMQTKMEKFGVMVYRDKDSDNLKPVMRNFNAK